MLNHSINQLSFFLSFLPFFFTGTTGEPPGDPSTRERTHDRGRSHERKHHSSSGDKQRYYSCDRYSSREHCAGAATTAKSTTASCATSPSEAHEPGLNKQVGQGGPGLSQGMKRVL